MKVMAKTAIKVTKAVIKAVTKAVTKVFVTKTLFTRTHNAATLVRKSIPFN